jgi:hypothetical protein
MSIYLRLNFYLAYVFILQIRSLWLYTSLIPKHLFFSWMKKKKKKKKKLKNGKKNFFKKNKKK